MRDVRGLLRIGSIMAPLVLGDFAFAVDIKDMLGRWTWQRFTIEVKECADRKICAKIVGGPKNVGLEIFASELTNKEGAWFGDVVDPETNTTYNPHAVDRFGDLAPRRLHRFEGLSQRRIRKGGLMIGLLSNQFRVPAKTAQMPTITSAAPMCQKEIRRNWSLEGAPML